MRIIAPHQIFNALFFCVCMYLVGCAYSPVAPDNTVAEEPPTAPIDSDEPTYSVDFKNAENDGSARVLSFELETVAEADSYEIQIRPANNLMIKPQSIITSRARLRLKITPGNFEIRTRSIAVSTARGGWSEWQPVIVPIRQPLEVYPKANSIVPAKSNVAENLSFEWPKNPLARAYRFKLYDENKVLLRNIVTEKNWNLEKLDLNRSYNWSVQPMNSLDEKETAGLEKTIQFTFSEPVQELIAVEFKLPPNPRAVMYQFEFVRMISDDENSPPTIFESREADYKARLDPGHYTYRTRSVFDDGTSGAWSQPLKLLVSIPRPALNEPAKDSFVDPNDDEANKIEFAWKEAKWAVSYLVSVYSEGRLVASAEPKENRVSIELPHDKVYHWSVVPRLATSKSRPPSATYEPDEQDRTFSIGHYIKLNLGGAEEPSQLYAWGRFIYSDVAYQSENFDQNSRIRQSVLVTSAELASGYWYRKTNYGGMVSAQISGIDIGGKTATYNQYSALLGYRMTFSEQRRLRMWLGPSIKETPELVPSGFTRQIDIRSIQTLGASALIAFFDSFTENLGVQLYGGSFYGIKGLDTPNGLDQKSFISFFASAYGTYRVTPNILGLLGVTYQSDTAGYKSSDRSGKDNRVLFAGNYLSFSLIFGLQEPEK